ncbi:MAG: hypothetical protein KDA83_12755 [Planctomycetales bacterium]|nr:hypothetical protein [Planctomycetales bacterium]
MPNSPSSTRFAIALYLLSAAAVLFSLSLFRLISFFIMPSLFFDLLLVCFPIGAAAAMFWPGKPGERFSQALPLLQLVMALTIAATLSLKHFDFMRNNLLFNQSPFSIFIQIAIFSAIYSPFFMAYGATEYLGYLAGRERLKRRMNGVYALVLFGAASAFLLGLAQQYIGITRLFVIALLLISVVKLALRAGKPALRGIEVVVLVGALVYPGTDTMFMQLFKSNKNFSVANYKEDVASRAAAGRNITAETLHQGWGRYSYFEVLQIKDESRRTLTGFYNDMSQWWYMPGEPTEQDFREAMLQPFLENAKSVCVIGCGGGRDIKLAREAGVERMLAIDVEPAIERVVRGSLADSFENVYSQDDVKLVIGDARTYLETHEDKYDAIFFWSVGGYPQLMLEPGNMIRTQEALTAFLSRLEPEGCFFLGYDRALDPDLVLLRQYATTLSGAGAHVAAFENHQESINEFALIALSPNASPAQIEQWEKTLASLPNRVAGRRVTRIPDAELVQPNFKPVVDDRPYLGGNISTILSPENIQQLFYLIAVTLGVIVAAIWFLLAKTDDAHQKPGVSTQILAVLLGMNFILLEHLVVLEVFRTSYTYSDALILGVVLFLTFTGLGSLLIREAWLKKLVYLSWIGPIAWLLFPAAGGTWVALGALLVATMVTGNLFPILFERNAKHRLYIFALDAIGAAIGAMIAFFLPILYGLTVLRQAAIAIYLVTCVAMLFFVLIKPAPQEEPSEEPSAEPESADGIATTH